MTKKSVWIGLTIVAVVVLGVLLVRQNEPGETVIRFGASFPLTGEVASHGVKAQRGIELAVADVNDAGGLLGRKVSVDFHGDHLVLETKGRDTEQDKVKRRYLDEWTQAVNAHGGFGRWRWAVVKAPGDIRDILISHLEV